MTSREASPRGWTIPWRLNRVKEALRRAIAGRWKRRRPALLAGLPVLVLPKVRFFPRKGRRNAPGVPHEPWWAFPGEDDQVPPRLADPRPGETEEGGA